MKNKNIAIVWWWLNGIFLAYEFVKKWYTNITLYEKGSAVWWLLGCYDFDWVKLEKYYHHVFNTDKNLLDLIQELWLQNDLIFKESSIGNLKNGKIVPFVTPMDLFKYPYLSFLSKIRVWFFSLFLQKCPYGEKFRNLKVESWIKKYMGRWAWNNLWKPIFQKKFHQYTSTLSLSFLWTRLYIRANSREWGKEMLWYMKWSFYRIVDRVVVSLQNKVIIKTNSNIQSFDDYRLVVDWISYHYDIIVSTLATPIFADLIDANVYKSFYSALHSVNYLSVICPLFVFDKPITTYYRINNVDESIDIWWIIEHTNLFNFPDYHNKKFMYFSHYLTSLSPLLKMDEEYLKSYYLDVFKKALHISEQPKDIYIAKDMFAQPVYTADFPNELIGFKTPILGVYQCNMVNFLPIERGINSSIMIAKKFIDYISFHGNH